MNKKIISLLVSSGIFFNAGTLAIASPLNTYSVEATDSNNDSLDENKTKYKELDSKIISLNSSLNTLQEEIKKLNEILSKNAIDISNVQLEISDIENNITTLKQETTRTQEILGQRIRGLYMLDNSQNSLTYLITSENFSEFLSRINALKTIHSADKQLIDELISNQKHLDDNLLVLQDKKNLLNQLNDTTKSDIEELNIKQNEYEKQLNEFNKEKDQVELIITANEEDLISHSVSIINTSSSLSEIQDATNSLQEITKQLIVESVISKANEAINLGNSKINKLSTDNNTSSNGTNSPISNSNNSTTASSKNPSSYKAEYSMVATAYTGGGLTAMGVKPVRNENGISTIAVDPKVIPLGSKVYIPGYGYAIASDTGGAIKGNKIDLYLNSTSACLNFGRQTVKLYLIAYPGEW